MKSTFDSHSSKSPKPLKVGQTFNLRAGPVKIVEYYDVEFNPNYETSIQVIVVKPEKGNAYYGTEAAYLCVARDYEIIISWVFDRKEAEVIARGFSKIVKDLK